jgi:RNA polymerase sigma factor (sigma-70 family)
MPSPPNAMQSALLYHFCRLRLPQVLLPRQRFEEHLHRAYAHYETRRDQTASFLEALHTLDWFLASACLDGHAAAWETLFSSRASRTDALLIDALRLRAARLYPRDEERQEEAVTEFWGYLLAGERQGTLPILHRYDGLRPLVPWLIRVFHNWQLSKLRKGAAELPLPEVEELPPREWSASHNSEARWHEHFRAAAREWLDGLRDEEILLLGLRLRYRLSQREAAKVLGIHEGNVTRRMNKLSEKAHLQIEQTLVELGWTGEDLRPFIQTEMLPLLLDEPRLAADRLATLLAARGQTPPVPVASEEGYESEERA